jgi:hypothetical protein
VIWYFWILEILLPFFSCFSVIFLSMHVDTLRFIKYCTCCSMSSLSLFCHIFPFKNVSWNDISSSCPFSFCCTLRCRDLKTAMFEISWYDLVHIGGCPPPWGAGGFIYKVAILLGELVSCWRFLGFKANSLLRLGLWWHKWMNWLPTLTWCWLQVL